MSTAMRITWLLTLALFVGGCSSYRSVSPQPQTGPMEGQAFPIKEGDEVVITMKNDGEVKGRVQAATPQQITFKVDTRNDLFDAVGTEDEVVQIPTESVLTIEKRCFSVGKTLALIGGIALPLVAIGVSYESPSFSFEDGDWGSIGPYQYSTVRRR